jgi:4-amino-4-deoxy-L-arabinose transferase-like glycosyltransferase
MIESSDRVEQFKAEIADMHIKDPAAGRDAQLLKGGAVVMLVGIVVTIVAYFMSHGTSNPLTQNDAQTVGMIGIAVSVVGAAVFLRYSLAQFLRFWLARLIYEQQAQTDRVLGSARPSSVGSDV